jgi:hypothetical protein
MSAPAAAAPAIALASDVYVERSTASTARVLQPAQQLSSGDRIVTIVSWKRLSNGGQFTVTNPLPRSLYFQGSDREDEEVSVDGGKSWGRLGALRVGNRLATPEDVTHLRWKITAPGSSGRIAYSAIVR